ncbi:MAG: Chemotaxis protein methyltransferase [Syntrophorhabdus sp. PtaU1.Bin058]|nr:MAG: Chemotaxis protein methyltransferase [Syntrophorhabdus sp. PtaU1.Bin058]
MTEGQKEIRKEEGAAGIAGPVSMSIKDFNRLSRFIHKECGINITPTKRAMLEGRLNRRLKRLGMRSFAEYCDYLFSKQGIESELIWMIDEVTTNKTDFFREPVHFEYLTKRILPELADIARRFGHKRLAVWSAGCSSGEEPYTLAMVINEFIDTNPRTNLSYIVIATDISPSVLEKAEKAVYEDEKVTSVPSEMKKKYLLRGKDKMKNFVRIVPELREHVKFRRLNFMDGDFGFNETIDIIFCRNVIIYFDRQTQKTLLNKFCRCLSPGGYVFMGHSETLFGMDIPLAQIIPTVYRKIP